MYTRTKTFTNKDGSTRTYLQIVEAVRENDKVRQKVLLNLGRLEELQKREFRPSDCKPGQVFEKEMDPG